MAGKPIARHDAGIVYAVFAQATHGCRGSCIAATHGLDAVCATRRPNAPSGRKGAGDARTRSVRSASSRERRSSRAASPVCPTDSAVAEIHTREGMGAALSGQRTLHTRGPPSFGGGKSEHRRPTRTPGPPSFRKCGCQTGPITVRKGARRGSLRSRGSRARRRSGRPAFFRHRAWTRNFWKP